MTDEELITRLRSDVFGTPIAVCAADRIDQLKSALEDARCALIEASIHIATSPISIRRNRKHMIDSALVDATAALEGGAA